MTIDESTGPRLQTVKVPQDYTKLLDTAVNIMAKTAATYVPELCALLRDANPNISNRDIRRRVLDDTDDIWAWGTVEKYWPAWIKDPTKVMMAKERAAKQRQLKQINETFRAIPKAEPQDFHETRDYEELHVNRPLPFRPQMLVDEYGQRDEFYQYKPQDIVRLSNALNTAIEEYFPSTYRTQNLPENVLRMLDRWNAQEIHEVKKSVGMIKVRIDALHHALSKSGLIPR